MSEQKKPVKRIINKQKTKTPMREQPGCERIKNFNEVPLGYSEEEARA